MKKKNYFYGIARSNDGDYFPYFRHETDLEVDELEFIATSELYVIECFIIKGRTRKQAVAVFHEYEEEFNKNGYVIERSIENEWFDTIRDCKGNIPEAVKLLTLKYGKENLPPFVRC